MKQTLSARSDKGHLKKFPLISGAMKGFSVLDMTVVLSVILICVLVGAPSVSDFTIRGKLVNALSVAEAAKQAVTMTCATNPALDELNHVLLGYEFHKTEYVKDVKVDGSCLKPVITLFTVNTGSSFDPIIAVHGDFDHTGSILWSCKSDGVNDWLPETCRT